MSFRIRFFGLVLVSLSFLAATEPTFAQHWKTVRNFPGVDMRGLNSAQQDMVIQILREEDCPCGCGMKLAQCRVDDETCPLSPKLVKIATDAARRGHSSIEVRSAIVTQLPPDKMQKAMTFEAIRAAAMSRRFFEPEFQFPPQRNRGTLIYSFGPDRDGDGGPIPAEYYMSPVDAVIDLQQTIEELRKFRRNDFWEPHLKRAESVVKKQVEWLNTGREPDDERLNREVLALASRGYHILDQAVQGVGRDYGWNVSLRFATKAAPEFSYFKATIKPSGAKLYYATDAEFRAMARLGLRAIRDVDRNWQEIFDYDGEEYSIPHAGKIRFYVVWPNGRENMAIVNLRKSDPVKAPYINRFAIGRL